MSIFSNEASGLFNQTSYFAFFYADGDMNNKKKQIENLFILNTTILKACKKWQRQEIAKKIFQKLYQWLLISFDFWILWISVLKNLLALTLWLLNPRFIFVTQALYL